MHPSTGTAWKILDDYCHSEHVSNSEAVRDVCRKCREVYPKFHDSRIVFTNTFSTGFGMLALADIPYGELILVDHPVVCISDIDLGVSPFGNMDGGDSLALLQVLSEEFDKSIESCFSNLYPIRGSNSLNEQKMDIIPERINCLLASKLPESMSPDSVLRAVQLNSLGYYTFPELCTYNEHLRFLSGTGIYPTASMFNHSCSPNVHHYSFGNVALFRTLRDVAAGEELFITYIGRDLLCETKSVRDEFLGNRDFVCRCSKCLIPDLDDPWREELDLETRISIHMAPSNEARLSLLRSLLANTSYITRDKIELQFSLCRALGGTNRAAWESLIALLDPSDFLYVVVLVHFMVHCGYDRSVADCIENSSNALLGTRDCIKLFEVTDFASSELRPKFIDMCNSIV